MTEHDDAKGLRMTAPNGIELITNPIKMADGSPGFVFAIAIPARMYAAADPIVGPAFTALAKALQVVKP